MGRIKDLSSALPTETDAFVFDGSNGTKKLTYNNLKQIIIDDVSDDIEEEIRQIYVIDNELDESSAHAVANSAVARAVNANSSAIDSINNVMSSLQTSQNNLINRVDDLEEDLQEQLLSTFVTESTSGSIASFDDGADNIPVKDLVVNITPKQASGTPSPDNVLPITGWTAANITRTGKNMIDVSQFATLYPNLCSYSDGVLTVTAEIVLWRTGITIDAPAGAVLSWGAITNITSSAARLRVAYEDGTAVDINGSPYTLTKRAIGLRLNWSTGGQFTISNIMISTDDSGYEEFVASYAHNISFGSAGTVYGGTLDVTGGMLTVNMAYTTLQSYLTWSGFYTANNIKRLVSSPYLNGAITTMCDTLQAFQIQSGISDRTLNSISITQDGRFVITPSFIQSATTANEAKAILMAADPIHLVYTLANPISYQLTPTEVRTLLGNNNIWSDTGSVESCEYRADTSLVINKLINAIVSLGGNI